MTRTLIYGSCVSRDTLEYLRPAGFNLVHYTARQSLASAYSPRDLAELPPVQVSSSFQRRMLEGDWRANLISTLREHHRSADMVLWDLCDERLGLRANKSGQLATRSVDSVGTGLDDFLSAETMIPFGSQHHFQLFSRALTRLRKDLEDLELLDRLIVLAPAWASHQEDGRAAPDSYGLTASEANQSFSQYYGAIEDLLSVPMVRLSADAVRADADHRWGAAPFHYAPSTYYRLAQEILPLRPHRTHLRVGPSTGATNAPDPIASRTTPVAPIVLTTSALPLAHPSPRGTWRIPVHLGPTVKRWRLRASNSNDRTGKQYQGRASVTRIALDDCLLTATPLSVSGSTGLVSPWFDIPLGQRPQVLEVSIGNTSGTIGCTYGAALHQPNPTDEWQAQRLVPLQWHLDVEVPDGTPVVGIWGDSLSMGVGTTKEIVDSPLSLACRTLGAIPWHLGNLGSGMSLWTSEQPWTWGRWAPYARPELVVHFMGQNDLARPSTTLDSLQQLFLHTLPYLRHHTSSTVVVASLTPRTQPLAHNEGARQTYNAWLSTRPEHTNGFVDLARAIATDQDPSIARAELMHDQTHVNTAGALRVSDILAASLRKHLG